MSCLLLECASGRAVQRLVVVVRKRSSKAICAWCWQLRMTEDCYCRAEQKRRIIRTVRKRRHYQRERESGLMLALSCSAAIWLRTELKVVGFPLVVLSMIGIGLMAHAAYRDLTPLRCRSQRAAGH